MNWLAKVAARKAMSMLPGGATPQPVLPDRVKLEQRLNTGLQYLESLEKLGAAGRLKAGAHFDFGCGPHPVIPLLYYAMGCDRQFLFDPMPLLDETQLDATIAIFLEIINDPAWPHRKKIRRLPEQKPGHPLTEHLESMGITPISLSDGKFTSIDAKIDVATSTMFLQQINISELKTSLASIHASLRKGGYFMATVRMEDEYAAIDPEISRYNHLRYSPWVWEKLINSRTMSHNRLRPRDYHELLESTGLRIEQFDIEGPTPADLEELRNIRIHPSFAHHPPEELGARSLTFTTIKP
ncbi:MAG: hypothetical protein WCD79_01910 [Chthoniobacteraceae bacterium]